LEGKGGKKLTKETRKRGNTFKKKGKNVHLKREQTYQSGRVLKLEGKSERIKAGKMPLHLTRKLRPNA